MYTQVRGWLEGMITNFVDIGSFKDSVLSCDSCQREGWISREMLKDGEGMSNNAGYSQKIRNIVWELTQVWLKMRDADTISGNNMFLEQCRALLNLAEEMLKGEDE